MKREIKRTTMLLYVLCITLSIVAQSDLSQQVKIYHNGKVTNQLTIDSITVEETSGPVIPGKNWVILGGYTDENNNYQRSVIYNGVEIAPKLNAPDDPNPEYPYNYQAALYDGTDLYILGYRLVKDAISGGVNYRFAVWKNHEYLYGLVPNLTGPYPTGFDVDNGNVYIYGICYDSNYEYEKGFYIKNQGTPVVKSDKIRGFDVYNDEVAYVTEFYTNLHYHSSNKAWEWVPVWQLFYKGNSDIIQSVDRSKRHWVQDMKIRNGIPYIVGYTDGYDDNGNMVYSVAYYNGTTFSNISLEQYKRLEGRLITHDEQGNVYLLCYAENEGVYVVLKNGTFMYEMAASEGFDVLRIVDRSAHSIAVNGTDVYVSGREISKEKDSNGDHIYNGILWKNGEIIWRRENGKIDNIYIY